jgi:hypothetical protein
MRINSEAALCSLFFSAIVFSLFSAQSQDKLLFSIHHRSSNAPREYLQLVRGCIIVLKKSCYLATRLLACRRILQEQRRVVQIVSQATATTRCTSWRTPPRLTTLRVVRLQFRTSFNLFSIFTFSLSRFQQDNHLLGFSSSGLLSAKRATLAFMARPLFVLHT